MLFSEQIETISWLLTVPDSSWMIANIFSVVIICLYMWRVWGMQHNKPVTLTLVWRKSFGGWGVYLKHLEENGKKISSQPGFLENKSYEE